MAGGAQPGNQNARKGRMFEQALVREIKQRDLKDGEGETMRKIAAHWIDMATAGDPFFNKELRDTLDGKPAQVIQGDPDNPLGFDSIKVVLVAPKDRKDG